MKMDTLRTTLTNELRMVRVESARESLEEMLVGPYEVFPKWMDQTDLPSFWCVAECPNGARLLFASPNQWCSDQWIVLSKGRNYVDGDDIWYSTLEDAFYQSGAWKGELPPNYEVS